LEALKYFDDGFANEPEGGETIPEPVIDKAVLIKWGFRYHHRGASNTTAPSPHRDFDQVSSAATPANSKCHSTVIKIFLGNVELRWGAQQ
jgi:hypothetical protein